MREGPKVGEILVRAGVIDPYQLRAALGEQARWGRPLGATLVKLGFVEERDLVRALASQLSMPIATLEGKRIPQKIVELVPGEIAEVHMVMPLFVRKDGALDVLYLGVEDPSNLDVLDDLSFRTGMSIRPVMVCASELCEAIDRYYRRRAIDAPTVQGDAPPEGLGSAVSATAPPEELDLRGSDAGLADELELGGDGSARLDELGLDEESTAPVIDVAGVADRPAASGAGASVIAPGTEELARHWSIGADEPLEIDDETLPDATGSEPAERAPAAQMAEPPAAPGASRSPATPVAAPVEAAASGDISSDDLRIATPPDPYTVKTRLILHSLVQLLIEKGVMTREELHAKFHELHAGGDGND